MLKHERSYYGVRLSFMASDMENVAARNSEAKAKFAAIRDAAYEDIQTALEGGRVDSEILVDWVALNEILGEPEVTLKWYDKVKDVARWQPLVERVARDLQPLLLAEKRWADAGRLYSDPLQHLQQMHEIHELTAEHRLDDDLSEQQKSMMERLQRLQEQRFRDDIAKVYASLLAADRKEAEKYAARARELDKDAVKMAATLIDQALEAGEPRPQHLKWISQAPADQQEGLADLRTRVKRALQEQDDRTAGDSQ
jgi:hypothetical protein